MISFSRAEFAFRCVSGMGMGDRDTRLGSGFDGGGRGADPDAAEAVFLMMQERLDALSKAPIVRNDPTSRGLLEEMARASDMDDVLLLLDRLDARITALRQRRGVAAPIPSETGERARRTVLRL